MSFIRRFFKFVGTDEYIQIIFIGPETDEYKVIFIGLDRTPTNIWAVRFDFDRSHIFIGRATSPTNIRGIYSTATRCHRRVSGTQATVTGPHIFIGRRDLEIRCFLFLSSQRYSFHSLFRSSHSHAIAAATVRHRRRPNGEFFSELV
jgi:hypothetical protein